MATLGIVTLTQVLLTPGCTTVPPYARTPTSSAEAIPAQRVVKRSQAHKSAVWLQLEYSLGTPGKDFIPGTGRMGTGVALGGGYVLTARHVLEEPNDALLFREPAQLIGRSRPFPRWLSRPPGDTIPPRFLSATARLVAEGGPESDWAVIHTSEPMAFGAAAPLHQPALSPDFQMMDGTPVYLIGFPTRLMPHRNDTVSLTETPYVIGGRIRNGFLGPSMEYSYWGTDVGGASGGGVFLWNEANQQLELVGVLTHQASMHLSLSAALLFVPLHEIEAGAGISALIQSG